MRRLRVAAYPILSPESDWYSRSTVTNPADFVRRVRPSADELGGVLSDVRARARYVGGSVAVASEVWKISGQGPQRQAYLDQAIRMLGRAQQEARDAAAERAWAERGLLGLPTDKREDFPAWADFRLERRRDAEGNATLYVSTGGNNPSPNTYTDAEMTEHMQQWADAANESLVRAGERPLL